VLAIGKPHGMVDKLQVSNLLSVCNFRADIAQKLRCATRCPIALSANPYDASSQRRDKVRSGFEDNAL
jgi:hypothetical protein